MRTTPSPSHAAQRLSQPYQQQATGDGVVVSFYLDKAPTLPGGLLVFANGLLQTPALNGTPNDYSLSANKITFASAPTGPLLFFVLSV